MGMLIFGASLAALGVAIMLIAMVSRFSQNRAQSAMRVDALRALVDHTEAPEVPEVTEVAEKTTRPVQGWGLKVRQPIAARAVSNQFVVTVVDASSANGQVSFRNREVSLD